MNDSSAGRVRLLPGQSERGCLESRDVDLITVREADALVKLPEAERKDWQAFWKDYEALMRKAGEAKPR